MINKEEVLTAVKNFLADTATNSFVQYSSMKIRYEKPFVDRIWFNYKNIRINLHKIHEVSHHEEPLWHPHDVEIMIIPVKGSMWVEIGDRDQVLNRLLITSPSWYEMRSPLSWHRVVPIGGAAWSIMVSGPKFPKAEFFPKPSQPQQPLSTLEENILLDEFHEIFFYDVGGSGILEE